MLRNLMLITGLTCLFYGTILAQPWMEASNDAGPINFYEVQSEFESYWEGRKIEKGKGYKQFKRWEWYWESRINEDGTLPPAGIVQTEWEKYLSQKKKGQASESQLPANWSSLGPNSTTGGYAGLGRIGAIAFHPTNSGTIFIGSPGGGLWKTTNNGGNWTPLTDNLGSIGVSGIVVNTSNPNVMYIASGDGDASDTYSIGVLKSTDGGATWATTGLNWVPNNGRVIRKLIQDPNDENTLFAATSNGLYGTVDAGVTWTQLETGSFYDVVAKPDAIANTFYATRRSGTTSYVHVSTDNGNTWSQTWSLSGCNRMALGVSADNSSYVYVLGSSSDDNGLKGVYRSTNSGTSFILRADSPNLLGWNSTGSDSGGQGWYDLIITADPTDANVVYVGGVNTWKSTNGGSSWTINTMWTNSGGIPTVHADKHNFAWQNNTTLYQGNDGGIYKTTNGGSSWTDLSSGLEISQMYKLGVSQSDNRIICGLQDNGTKLKSSTGTWTDEVGGDGMECAIHPTNSDVMYAELYYGEIRRSTNGGGSWADIQNNIPGNPEGAWVTPFVLDPNAPATIYAGFTDVYKSTNQGSNWTAISNNLSSVNLRYISVASSNSNYIYAGTSADMWRTTNGGTTWSALSPPSSSLNMLAIHPGNPNILWAVRGGFSNGNKVYKSTDGGSSWTNISGTLPNLPANCIVYQSSSNDGLYLGMDVGIYYKDNTLTDWVLYNTNLPNAPISELEIHTTNGKLLAATYGRGLWESDLYSITNDYLTTSTGQLNLQYSAGSSTFDISSNVAWTVSANDPWITVSPISGNNNQTVTVTVTENTASSARTGTVSITGGSLSQIVTIDQAGAPIAGCGNIQEWANNSISTAPNLALFYERFAQIGSPTDVDYYKFVIGGNNTTYNTRISLKNLPADYDLSVLDAASNVLASSSTVGTADEEISIDLITGTYYLKVEGVGGAFSSSECYALLIDRQTRLLLVNPGTMRVNKLAGFNRADILANVDWTATSNASWLTPQITAGTASSAIYFNYDENTSGLARTGIITISGAGLSRSFKVIQGTSGCANASEPANDAILTAPAIPLNREKLSQIATATDNDYWKFTVSGSVPRAIQLFLTNLPDDYDMKLFNNAGSTLATSQNGNTDDEYIAQTLNPGVYYVRIYGWNGAHSTSQCYALTVTNTAARLYVYPTQWKVQYPAGTANYSVYSNMDWSTNNPAPWITTTTTAGSGDGFVLVDYDEHATSGNRTGTFKVTAGSITRTLKVLQYDHPSLLKEDEVEMDREDLASENELNQSISLYPNPTEGSTFLIIDNSLNTRIRIFNSQGALVKTMQGSESIEIDLRGYPTGMYQIEVLNGSDLIVRNLLLLGQ